MDLPTLKINPSNFYDRFYKKLPPHLYTTIIEVNQGHVDGHINIIKKWIFKNLEGKFWIRKTVNYNTFTTEILAGFEKQEELTFFLLSGIGQIKN